MISGAEHRLAIGVACLGALAPPARSFNWIAFDAKRIVVEHANACHRRANSLRGGGERKSPGLDGIERDCATFEQHPAQHVLGRTVALLSRRAVKCGGTELVPLDALTLEPERRQIALRNRVASISRRCQPLDRKFRVSLDPKAFGEAGADIVLRPGVSCARQRLPRRRARP